MRSIVEKRTNSTRVWWTWTLRSRQIAQVEERAIPSRLHRIGHLQPWRKPISLIQKVKFCALNKHGCSSTKPSSNSHHLVTPLKAVLQNRLEYLARHSAWPSKTAAKWPFIDQPPKFHSCITKLQKSMSLKEAGNKVCTTLGRLRQI